MGGLRHEAQSDDGYIDMEHCNSGSQMTRDNRYELWHKPIVHIDIYQGVVSVLVCQLFHIIPVERFSFSEMAEH